MSSIVQLFSTGSSSVVELNLFFFNYLNIINIQRKHHHIRKKTYLVHSSLLQYSYILRTYVLSRYFRKIEVLLHLLSRIYGIHINIRFTSLTRIFPCKKTYYTGAYYVKVILNTHACRYTSRYILVLATGYTLRYVLLRKSFDKVFVVDTPVII